MLETNPRVGQNNGFLLTGQYSLLIVPIVDGDLQMDSPLREYVFEPNPTDVDVEDSIPNVVQPDQASGFYTEVNEISQRFVRLRGTTGQRSGGQRRGYTDDVRSAFGSLVPDSRRLTNLLSSGNRSDGYTKFMDLHNFFADWYRRIRSDPSNVAMLYINTKDAEILQVLPMAFTRPRTAGRPLQYGYTIALQAVAEYELTARMRQGSWLERMNSIRTQVTRWRQAVNQAVLVATYMMSTSISSVYSTATSPIRDLTNTFRGMSAGIQGLSYTANCAQLAGISSVEEFTRAAEALWGSDDVTSQLDMGGYNGGGLLPRSASEVVPPTRYSVGAVFEGVVDIFDATTEVVNVSNSGGAQPGLNPDDPFVDQYTASFDLWIGSILATELAPLSDYSPTGSASDAAGHMHQAARAGSAGYLSGREDEFTSATLAAETYLLDGVRHPAVGNTSAQHFSLSYIASMVMSAWSRGNDTRISPELDSFRRGFLGMRNPATLSPLYRIVDIKGTDTVYTLAQRHLGSWRRWYEIVLINDLQYPYVSPAGGLSAKTTGESIYIPAPDASVPVELVERLLRLSGVHDLVKLQDAFLGFDIEIGSDGDAVYEKHDVAHVAGIKAFEQEYGIVLEGTGGVTPMRTPGLGLRIGTKSNGARTLTLWSGLLRAMFAGDSRVAAVDSLRVVQDASAVYFSSSLKFKNYDSTVTVAGTLRSA